MSDIETLAPEEQLLVRERVISLTESIQQKALQGLRGASEGKQHALPGKVDAQDQEAQSLRVRGGMAVLYDGLMMQRMGRLRTHHLPIRIPIAIAMCLLVSVQLSDAAATHPTSAPTSAESDPLVEKAAIWLADPSHDLGTIANAPWAFEPLDRRQCEQLHTLMLRSWNEQIRHNDQADFQNDTVKAGGQTLKLLTKHFGKKPEAGWPMFISMHGGGNAPAEVNDQQWQNQIKLYQPENAFYVAPRAPGNTWDLWHTPQVDALFDRLIADAVALGDVDPNRVYLMGYSAGGDGVYQLAPRMADRFAAASMMAGHPNDAKPDGLRNLPFAIHVGALDDGYGRNKVAQQWKDSLDALHTADPAGYVHDVQIHPGRAHWMNLEDRSAVPWMAGFTRDPLPAKVVWRQGHATHDRFYWLAVPAGVAKLDQLIVASRTNQNITLEKVEGVNQVTILLNDRMVDVDKPVTVLFGRQRIFSGIVRRTAAVEATTLAGRGDPSDTFDASITVRVSNEPPHGQPIDVQELNRAVAYLKSNMPARDRDHLDDAFLIDHASYALAARSQFPWGKDVPDELFQEYVLPYANVDEAREAWRDDLQPIACEIVAGCGTAGDAARKLNAELFRGVHVQYHATRRPFANQSPAESMACGYASCTGLSILLIDACRAVGIPARLVGIESWIAASGPTFGAGLGNHTWVEIWDGRQWRFLGASEPSELDKTWFVAAAARSNADVPAHAIFATAFAPAADHFLMAWDQGDTSVPAVNVTRYYTARSTVHINAPAHGKVEVREGGRIVAAGEPGDFILAKGGKYTVRTFDGNGNRMANDESELIP